MGAALSPMNAFMLLQGLETLSLRMERICENTQKVAEYLENHPDVTWVNYAGLPSHKDYALAQKYMGGKASGILSFGLNSGREGTRKFYDALQIFLRLVNIGDCKSLASIPAETTHRQLNDEELKSAGVSPEMVRLSIGIEHVDDLIADLDQALAQAHN
jgi:O-acetylhomoserine (thiol)-lyase